jgi:hypothetical protein
MTTNLRKKSEVKSLDVLQRKTITKFGVFDTLRKTRKRLLGQKDSRQSAMFYLLNLVCAYMFIVHSEN